MVWQLHLQKNHIILKFLKYHNGGKMPGICTRKLHLHVAPQKESDGHMAKKKKINSFVRCVDTRYSLYEANECLIGQQEVKQLLTAFRGIKRP